MRILALILALLLPFAAMAQEDDKGYLTRLIEDALSSDRQKVTLDGFVGALSSSARFSRLTIADESGVWLTIEDARLDWTRSALLRGRLEVAELSAGLIAIERLPPGQEDAGLTLPSPTSSVVRIPDLPVELHVGRIAAGTLRLGPAVLGEEVVATADGALDVANGAGDARIALERTDGKEGRLMLDAGFDNASRQLRIDLDLAEAGGGVLANMLGLPGRPALQFTIAGNAPVSDFAAAISLRTNGAERLGGTLGVADLPENDGLRYALGLSGNVTPLVEPDYRRFFGTESDLALEGKMLTDGRLTVERLALSSQELTLSGSLELAADGMPQRFDLAGRLSPAGGGSVLLPLTGPDIRISGAGISAEFDAAKGDAFGFDIAFTGYESAGNAIASGRLTGDGEIIRGAARGITARVAADLAGMALADPGLARALGREVAGRLVLGWTEGGPLRLTGVDLGAGPGRVTGAADLTLTDGILRIAGQMRAALSDLAPYSGLAGRPLGGAADAGIDGWIEPLGGAFDMVLDAQTRGLDLGEGVLAALAGGDGSFRGGIARGPGGTVFDNLAVETAQVSALVTGTLGDQSGRVTLDARLADVALIYPGLAGPANAKGELGRQGDRLEFDLSGQVPGGVTLTAEGSASADFATLDAAVDGSIADIAVLIPEFSGPVAAKGRVALAEGTLALDLATDGPEGAALQVTGDYATGTGEASLVVTGRAGLGLANRFTGGAAVLAGEARLDLVLAGPPGIGALSGTIAATGARVELPGAGVALPRVDLELALDADRRAEPEALLAAKLGARIPEVVAPGQDWVTLLGGAVEVQATLALLPGGRATFRDLDLRAGDMRLAGRGEVTGLGAGVVLNASLDAKLGDLARFTTLAGLPLGGAADVSADLGYEAATGILSAGIEAQASDLRAGDGALAALVAPVAVLRTRADLEGDRLRLRDLEIRNGDASLTGTAGIAGIGGEMVVSGDGTLTLASLGRLRPVTGLALSGALTATVAGEYRPDGGILSARVSGTTASLGAGGGPLHELIAGDGSFSAVLAGTGGKLTVSDARLATPALTVSAEFDGARVALDATLDSLGRFIEQLPGPVRVTGTVGMGQSHAVNLRASGPAGAAVSVTGAVSPALVPDLSISGTAPLGVANAFLPDAVDVQGNVALDLSVTGTLGLQGLGGRVTVSGGRAVLPGTGLVLTGLAGLADLSGGRAAVQLTSGFDSGGTASLEGTVGLTDGTPIDLALALNGVGFVQEPTFRTTLNGRLSLTGSLASGGLLRGAIELGESAVSLAFSGAEGTLLDIEHRGEPPGVTETRRRAGLLGVDAGASGSGTGGRLALDVTVSAPRRIFVRGRGLDAELGGELRLAGRAGAIIPIGHFELIRGRLDILGKRLELTEATLTLEGSFDPVVRLVATARAEDVNIEIVTEGNASAPRVSLQSSPDLPDDEILALLLFGKGLGKISALQALQLANAVATLIGSGGEGMQGRIRKQFGLDDLDLTTDENGSPALKAGKYLSENIYTDVTVNAEGEAEIQLNLDITPNLTARGKVGGDGGTSLGIFFEKDY